MRFVLTLVLTLAMLGEVVAANFVGASRDYLSAAEAARHDIAVFWTGKPLPGAWYEPCPIRVNVSPNLGAGGATTFSFDRGEVMGWRMRVQGSRQRILDSVIPHEVHHTVAASIARRPITRWLDEGMASLFEHTSEQARLRRTAKQNMDNPASVWFRFDAKEYPARGQDVLVLYATGFTLCEYLIDQKGVNTLWAFMMDSRPLSASFQDHYGVSINTARQGWKTWLTRLPAKYQGPLREWSTEYQIPEQAVNGEKPTLYVFTTTEFFCLPCFNFKNAYVYNAAFRQALQAKYNVQFKDVRVDRELAARCGVTAVPAFCPSNSSQHVQGYPGQRLLFAKLNALPTDGFRAAPPRQATTPAINGTRPRPTPAFDPEEFRQSILGDVSNTLNTRLTEFDSNLTQTLEAHQSSVNTAVTATASTSAADAVEKKLSPALTKILPDTMKPLLEENNKTIKKENQTLLDRGTALVESRIEKRLESSEHTNSKLEKTVGKVAPLAMWALGISATGGTAIALRYGWLGARALLAVRRRRKNRKNGGSEGNGGYGDGPGNPPQPQTPPPTPFANPVTPQMAAPTPQVNPPAMPTAAPTPQGYPPTMPTGAPTPQSQPPTMPTGAPTPQIAQPAMPTGAPTPQPQAPNVGPTAAPTPGQQTHNFGPTAAPTPGSQPQYAPTPPQGQPVVENVYVHTDGGDAWGNSLQEAMEMIARSAGDPMVGQNFGKVQELAQHIFQGKKTRQKIGPQGTLGWSDAQRATSLSQI